MKITNNTQCCSSNYCNNKTLPGKTSFPLIHKSYTCKGATNDHVISSIFNYTSFLWSSVFIKCHIFFTPFVFWLYILNQEQNEPLTSFYLIYLSLKFFLPSPRTGECVTSVMRTTALNNWLVREQKIAASLELVIISEFKNLCSSELYPECTLWLKKILICNVVEIQLSFMS